MTIKSLLTARQIERGSTLAPIRLLVLGAFFSAIMASIALAISVIHVMSTTDQYSMMEERGRAARLAEVLNTVPEAELSEALATLGGVAGLNNLSLASAPAEGPNAQSIPLLGGALGGQFLTWQAESPGEMLFRTHAPTRVPIIMALIACVFLCLLAMLRYVRVVEEQRAEAQRQALRDHLTGLPNRLALEGELGRLGESGNPLSILALDLDRFKPVNDLFGHHAGDMALIEVGDRLAAQLQPGEFLARIGGDEFVMIVDRGGDQAALTQLARDCIAAIGQPLKSLEGHGSVGISLGIVADSRAYPVNALLKQADKALYEAKRLDGGAFCFAGTGRAPKRTEQVKPEVQPMRASG